MEQFLPGRGVTLPAPASWTCPCGHTHLHSNTAGHVLHHHTDPSRLLTHPGAQGPRAPWPSLSQTGRMELRQGPRLHNLRAPVFESVGGMLPRGLLGSPGPVTCEIPGSTGRGTCSEMSPELSLNHGPFGSLPRERGTVSFSPWFWKGRDCLPCQVP